MVDDWDIITTGLVGLAGAVFAAMWSYAFLDGGYYGLIFGFALGVLAVCGRLLVVSLEDF